MDHRRRRDTGSPADRLAPPEERGGEGSAVRYVRPAQAADTIRPEVPPAADDTRDGASSSPLPRVVVVVVALLSLYAAVMFLLIRPRPEASKSTGPERWPAGNSARPPKNLLPPVKLFLWLLRTLAAPGLPEYGSPTPA